MKTLGIGPDRRLMGSGPFITTTDRKRGVWTAIAIIAVYLVLAAFYVMGLAG